MIESPDTTPGATGTQSFERAVLLLREIAAHGSRGARLTDLVADTGLAKPTVHRLLAALIREGLLEQAPETRRYFLGAELFVMGSIAAVRISAHQLPADDLRRIATLSSAKYSGPSVPLAALLCDHYPDARRGAVAALLHETAAGHTSRLSYAELQEHSKRFAAVLRSLGVKRGDRVATLLPKGPEVLITMLAAWRLGAVHVPLFTALGTQQVTYRLEHCGARTVVTNGTFHNKLSYEIATSPALRIVLVENEGAAAGPLGATLFWSSLHRAAPIDAVATFAGDDTFALLYLAGTTNSPRGLSVPIKALASIEQYMRVSLDVREDDVFWNIADPGWAGGLYYAVLGPLLLGRSVIFCDGPFDVGQIYRVLTKFGVTNLLAPPSWYHKMRGAEAMHPPPAGLRLRAASAIGEWLSEDLIGWAEQRFGVRVGDNYGQAELGIIIANPHAPGLQFPRLSGSLGRSLPGYRIVLLDAAGSPVAPGTEGEIAVDIEKSELYWFAGYENDGDGTADRFRHGPRFYMTGDKAMIDQDGNFFFLGRNVESVGSGVRAAEGIAEIEVFLASHRAIAAAAAIGKPDRLHGELIKIFVVLRPEIGASPDLAEEIVRFIKPKLNVDADPPEIEFVVALPWALQRVTRPEVGHSQGQSG
ncbi:MAG: amP-dependent synthetase and ligase [Rhodospirillales bacterium]|nr:amP-dependent synthetase and ligase [Rhodospirillales bacterium]